MFDLEKIGSVRSVVRVAARLRKEGRAIDLGSGVGRHALFLAKKGFRVTAVEGSPSAVAALRELARLQDLPVRAVRADVTAYKMLSAYDLVVATMLLHFLAPDVRDALVERMKKATRPGGVIATVDYSTSNPAGTRPHLVSPEDVRRWFPEPEWEIALLEHVESDPMPDLKRPGSTVSFWIVNVIARRVA